ncbi:AI-2E family transporter [Candidatus Woesearchaeota archaeon]|nr:AI-2E family transporter [Candidatus Woesearchaeota archaeon]
MYKELIKKYVPVVLFFITAVLCLLIIKPFIIPIITAVIIVYLFNPLYNEINKKIKNENISSFLLCMLVIVIIILPVLFIMNSLLNEIPSIINTFRNSGLISETFLQELNSFLFEFFGVSFNLDSVLNSVISWILQFSQEFLFSLPNAILNFFIMFSFIFYLFKDQNKIYEYLMHFIPLTKDQKNVLISDIKKTTRGVLYGHIATAIVQGIFAGIGFFIFGVNAAIFLGLLTMFLGLFPVAGAPLVYGPVSIYLLIENFQLNNYFGIIKGIGLLVYGVGIVSSIDNVIKPKIISDHAEIHPLIILIGVFGGVSLFGFLGFILGPLIFSIFLSILKVHK